MKKIKQYFYNVLIGLDQFGNSLWGGSPDETISSRLGRIKTANGGEIPWTRPWPKIMDWALDKIQKEHCIKAIEENEFEQIKNESVFDGEKGMD